ncbi:MAG: YbaB/EbfC family nucleoid-associated protein [Actinobacteria bacterium]|nr:YbaB/EbfC family nucleoid-associated protein [Actinomycetota bacterium]
MNIGKLLKEAQRIQAEISKLQEEIVKMEFESTAGGGVVKAVVNGSGQLISIKIDPEILKDIEAEELEDMILAAVNEASEKARSYMEARMAELTGGLGGLPGGFPPITGPMA